MHAGDLASQDDTFLHQNYDSLGDMSLFAFLDGAADEDFQYNVNDHQQTLPNMGPGFWDMMHSLDGAEVLDSLRSV